MVTERQIGLIFHGIGAPGRALEPGEAPYWISVAQFEDMLDKIRTHPQPDRFRISFDDGNMSDHDIALPRLIALGLRADFFVLSGRIGLAGSLDTAQILALRDAGMAIGSHGIAHRNWCQLDDPSLVAELADSRKALAAICGQPIITSGIPFGSYDARVLTALRRAGYEAAYSSDRGWMNPAAFVRPRTSVKATMSPAEIAALLSGHMALLPWLRRAISMARRRVG